MRPPHFSVPPTPPQLPALLTFPLTLASSAVLPPEPCLILNVLIFNPFIRPLAISQPFYISIPASLEWGAETLSGVRSAGAGHCPDPTVATPSVF